VVVHTAIACIIPVVQLLGEHKVCFVGANLVELGRRPGLAGD